MSEGGGGVTLPRRNGGPRSQQRDPPSSLGEGQTRDVERSKQFPPTLHIGEGKVT